MDAALADPDFPVFFDAAATHLRLDTLNRAIDAGKHIYTEKPIAPTVAQGIELMQRANAKDLKHGAVEDKLFLPGFRKLSHLMESGFFGRVVGFKLDFGWWVFDGIEAESQRPSWNYQKSGGGGLLSDMHPHWRYVIEGILGPIAHVACAAWTAQPERIDEDGNRYKVDVEDATATMLEMADGARGTITSSWATRVTATIWSPFRSMVRAARPSPACLRKCWAQSAADTPRIEGFNMGSGPETMDFDVDYDDHWTEVPDVAAYKNPYRFGWEGFIPHVVADALSPTHWRPGFATCNWRNPVNAVRRRSPGSIWRRSPDAELLLYWTKHKPEPASWPIFPFLISAATLMSVASAHGKALKQQIADNIDTYLARFAAGGLSAETARGKASNGST